MNGTKPWSRGQIVASVAGAALVVVGILLALLTKEGIYEDPESFGDSVWVTPWPWIGTAVACVLVGVTLVWLSYGVKCPQCGARVRRGETCRKCGASVRQLLLSISGESATPQGESQGGPGKPVVVEVPHAKEVQYKTGQVLAWGSVVFIFGGLFVAVEVDERFWPLIPVGGVLMVAGIVLAVLGWRRRCPACGARVKVRWSACPRCSTPLVFSGKDQKRQRAVEEQSRWSGAPCLVVLTLCGAAIALVVIAVV
jgi:ribosomal protein L32